MINLLALMRYVEPRTLVRARTTIRLGNYMALRECVRTPLILHSDSLHHRIRVIIYGINEHDRCDTRVTEDTKS